VNIKGLYSQDLKIKHYNSVILVAKDVSIASVLLYIRYLTNKKFNNKTVKTVKKEKKVKTPVDSQRLSQKSHNLYYNHTKKINLF
jgi:hypothetical protein